MPDLDWSALIAVANENLVTAELALTLPKDCIPTDASDYLSFIHARNALRNRRLKEQLQEVVTQLNALGVTPMLTKGSAHLAKTSDDDIGGRMMHDLDITVQCDELDRAHTALRDLGYRESPGIGWARDQDAGVVDLHFPPGRYPEYWPSDGLIKEHTHVVTMGNATALAPSAFLAARHALVHDMVKNGAWWLMSTRIRELYGLHQLDRGELDWSALYASMPNSFSRRIVASQYIVLRSLFPHSAIGRAPPLPLLSRLQARLRLSRTQTFVGRAAGWIGRALWLFHCAQIKWRRRDSMRSLLGGAGRKLLRCRA